jgi:hypothetical protein
MQSTSQDQFHLISLNEHTLLVHIGFLMNPNINFKFIKEVFHTIKFINFPNNIVDRELQSTITAVTNEVIWEQRSSATLFFLPNIFDAPSAAIEIKISRKIISCDSMFVQTA